MFINIKTYVSDLLWEIHQETQLKAEKEFSSLENNLKQYTTIPKNLLLPVSTTKLIEKTKSEIIEIKSKMKNNSYFDYLEILDVITVINSRLIKVKEELINFRNSSENQLKNLEVQSRKYNLHLEEASKKLKAYKSRKSFGSTIAIIAILSLVIGELTSNRYLILLLA